MAKQAVATAEPRASKLDHFMGVVITPDRRKEIERALPSHVNFDRFERNLLNALMQNPDLMNAEPRILWREVVKSVQLGLLLDPMLGEGFLIMVWDGKLQSKQPQFRAGWKGILKLVRQSGDGKEIYAHEVCRNDPFKAYMGTDKKLIHEPDIFKGRGEVVGYYAVIKSAAGGVDFEIMQKKDAERIRDEKSDGYKAFKAGKIKSNPWDSDFDEMAKKTILLKLLKRASKSPDVQNLISHEEASDFGGAEMRDVTPQTPPPPRPQIADFSEEKGEPSTIEETDQAVEGAAEDPFTFTDPHGEVNEQPLSEGEFLYALEDAMGENGMCSVGAALNSLLEHNADSIDRLSPGGKAELSTAIQGANKRLRREAVEHEHDPKPQETEKPNPVVVELTIEPQKNAQGRVKERPYQIDVLKVVNAAPDPATIDAILEANQDTIAGLAPMYRDAINAQAEKRKKAL